MDEAKKRNWEVGIGLLTPVIAIAGLLVGIWQFSSGQEKAAEAAFARELFLRKLEACSSLAGVVSEVLTESANRSATQLDEQTRGFEHAFWGNMILFADPTVESNLITFRHELLDFADGWSNALRLKRSGVRLLEACRVAVETGACGDAAQ